MLKCVFLEESELKPAQVVTVIVGLCHFVCKWGEVR